VNFHRVTLLLIFSFPFSASVRPFKIIFKTDANEMNASTAGANDATTSELNIFPGVNFINILLVHFCIDILAPKIT